MQSKISAEIQRASGNSKNSITLDIDGLGRRIVFKSGGVAESPVSVRASAGGGVYSEGLFEPWEVEGEVVVNKELAHFLLELYQKKNFSVITSAVLESYSATANATMKHTFLNVRISKIFSFGPDELGGETIMKIAFSLNDLENSEVL